MKPASAEEKRTQALIRQEFRKQEIRENKKTPETDTGTYTAALHSKLKDFAAKGEELVKAYGLLPVFDPKISIENAFPRLFIKPELETAEGNIQYDTLLKDYLQKNLVILGDAGSGKSTLLKYIARFENIDAIYVTAQDMHGSDSLLSVISELCNVEPESEYFLLIDGLDEAFWNDPAAYYEMNQKLFVLGSHVHFWMAARNDFYRKTYTEGKTLSIPAFTIRPWDPDRSKMFLGVWEEIYQQPEAKQNVIQWAEASDIFNEMFANPFQLTLVAYIAGSDHKFPKVKSAFDLYDTFFKLWFEKEEKRGTGAQNRLATLNQLRKAAEIIYASGKYRTTKMEDTAVTNLLIWEPLQDMEGYYTATMFRHHSLAAFLIAHEIYSAINNRNFEMLTSVLQRVQKDDVTNFVTRKTEKMEEADIARMRKNLSEYYQTLPMDDDSLVSVREKIVYYISRFPGDCSAFLLPIVRSNPVNPYMRLSLAYACVLSDLPEVRRFALEYARAISNEEEDAKINRGWTVVYFGDCDKDPYTYQDEDNGPWDNARAARLRRFCNTAPRVKDYRFWLFDIPLFHSFLKTRNWKGISKKEYEAIYKLSFPLDRFTVAESRFLWREKKAMLKVYKEKLEDAKF